MGRLADRASRKSSDSGEESSDAASTESEEEAVDDTDDTSDDETQSKDSSPDEKQLDETSDEAASDGNNDPDAVRHVKDRPSVYMYLPKEYSKEVDIACQMINLTYQRETGDKLPKNRYLYPIVTKIGYENAADFSFDEIQALKTEIDEIDADETEP